jgi:hypothetical protein
MSPITAQPLLALARLRTRLTRVLVTAAMLAGTLVVSAPAAASLGPAPDSAPHVGPDPADAGGAASPARRPSAVEQQQQHSPAPARQAPVQQSAPVAPVASAASAPPRETSAGHSQARSGSARRPKTARVTRPVRSGHVGRAAPLVLPGRSLIPSGPLLHRRPAATSSGGDEDAPMLLLASLALLLVVGASASFLHAATIGSDVPPRMRSA